MALLRHLRAPGFLLALAALAASCGGSSAVSLDSNGIPKGAVSAQWIQQASLSHLYYPGSKPFYSINAGSPETAGSAPADAGAILTSDATGAQIYAWYVRTLRAMGWTFVTDKGCLDIQPSCPQFGHDGHGQREAFFLAIDNPALLPSVIGRSAPPACTVYEVSYQIFPPGGIRVGSPMRWDGGHQCWWTGTAWTVPPGVP